MFSGVGKESEESGSETFNLHDKMEIVDLRYWKGYQVEEHTITVQIYLESEGSAPCQTGSLLQCGRRTRSTVIYELDINRDNTARGLLKIEDTLVLSHQLRTEPSPTLKYNNFGRTS